jgi:hypothetical protein
MINFEKNLSFNIKLKFNKSNNLKKKKVIYFKNKN